ncbi:MAG: hypothetical protein LUC85_11530 [Bacteroidales bacterium]|nr:hypothetical protein [Bacteroidales bacterium]
MNYYTGIVFLANSNNYTYNKPIYLLGSFTNWHDSGDPSDSYKFTQTAENIWWLNNLNISAGTEFKIFNYNTGYDNDTRYLGNEASGISADTRYQIWARAWSANMTSASVIKAIKVEYDTEDGLWYMTYYSDDIDTSVIQYVRVVEKSSGSYITLKSSNGTTWTGTGTVNSIVSSPSSDYDSYRYYISTSTDGSTWTNWVPSSTSDSNYWLSPSSTKTLKEQSSDQYLCFKTGATTTNGEAEITVTVTLNDAKSSAVSMVYIVGASALGVNMPLKASDFSKPHYFLVGVRTSGWRLLPEWELTDEDGDGVYELKDRLIYNGHFGIARVDSYEKYILHQYDAFFSNNGSNINTSTTSLTLNLSNAVSGCVTDKTTTNDGTTFWSLSRTLTKSDEWGDPSSFSTSAYEYSMPCYVGKLSFTPATDGQSGVFKVDEYSRSTSDIASHMTFTFVGSGIRYDNDGDYTIKGKGWYTNASGDGYGWGDGWYSWDANGKPYIDGYGKPIYVTAFNQEWLSNHPSYFYDSTKDFYYSSDNLTFVHYTDLEDYENDDYINVYKAHPAGITGASSTIPASISTSGWNYTEKFENSSASEKSYTINDWECFVVKDVWLRGDFKVWTGWGGASSLNEKDQTVDQARWYTDNGGHNNKDHKYGVAGYDLAGSEAVHVYGTKRDIYAADFRIVETDNTEDYDPQGASEMQFYNRAILWYNPSVGFNGSAIQLIKDTDGPMIQAQRKSGVKNKLQYRWSINAGTTEHTITKVTITRYVYKNGAFVAEKSWDVTGAVNKKNTDYSNAISTYTFTDDTNACEQGAYYYGISVLYDGYSKAKTATSNRIIISYTGAPVTVTMAQLKDSDSKLRLGLEINVAPKDGIEDKEYDDDSTIGDMMEGYWLVPESDLAKEAVAADRAAYQADNTKGHNWQIAGTDGVDTHAYADPTATDESTVKIAAGNYYLFVDIEGNEDGFTLELPRAAANTGVTNAASLAGYTFSAYLVLDDQDTDGWNQLALGQASATTDVELPAPAISHSGLEIKKNTDKINADFPSELKEMPLGALNHDGTEAEMPVKYKDVNEIVLPVELTDDNLSDEIFNDGFAVNYIVTVYDKDKNITLATKTISSSESKFGVVNINGDLRYIPVNVNNLTANTVGANDNIYYSLPGDYQVDVAIEAVDAASQVSSSKSANSDKVTVTKLSEGSPAAFSATIAGSPYFDYPVYSWDWTKQYTLRHGAVKFSTASTTETQDIITGVYNKDLNLYLGQEVAGCDATGYDGDWTEGHGANGGSYVPETGFYNQGDGYTYTGLSGYVEYTGTYDDSNNWAKLAADKALATDGVLPLQVIPLALGTPVTSGQDVPAIDNNGSITVGGGTWVWYVPVYTISDESGRTMGFDLDSSLVINNGYEGDFPIVIANRKATTSYSVIPFGVATSSIGNSGTGEMTGIEGVGYGATNDGEAAYYNLQGVRILNPAKGQIYLRVVGNKATKVLY